MYSQWKEEMNQQETRPTFTQKKKKHGLLTATSGQEKVLDLRSLMVGAINPEVNKLNPQKIVVPLDELGDLVVL